jgi:3-oxoacyl-[acyl-carrier-protein] synthase II
MMRCMALALEDAEVSPARVRHVYAHGTGTKENDRCEAEAIASLFPHRPAVSATKGLLGHTIGAAGAIDAVLAVKTLATGQAVPCANLDTPDPACDLNFVRDAEPPEANLASDAAVMVNTFAFGGQNAALVLGSAPQ